MKQILVCVGILSIAAGLLIFGGRVNAINEVVAAITLASGFILIAFAATIHAIDMACARLITAMWSQPPANEQQDG